MRYLFLLILCLFQVESNLFGAQKDGRYMKISGRVTDVNGEGLPATVSIHELNKGTAADIDGHFSFSGLKPGNYHIHFTYLGYRSHTEDIYLIVDDVHLDIHLKETSITLQSLTIEANPFKNGPVEQSQSIEVIDRDFMERNSSGTFANALEKLPGINTINTGVGISKPVIRGLGMNRIIVNDRGIKQEGQQWGSDHGLEIDPFDVDRVEVIKGPASLIYGSDGMAGVINISPAGLPSKGIIKGHILSHYRSNNHLLGNSAMVEGNIDDFVFKGRVTMQDFQNYRVPADQFSYAGYVLPIYENRLKNTAGKERHFSFMSGTRKNWGHSTITVSQFNQTAGIFSGAIGIPNSYNLRHNEGHSNIDIPRQVNSHLKIISNTNILVNKNWLEIDIGYQKNARREESFPHAHGVGPNPSDNLALGLNLDTYTANLRYDKRVNDKHQFILGGQAQYMINRREGFEFLIPDFTTVMGGMFFFHEYKWFNNLIVNGGVRIDGAAHSIEEHLQEVYQDLSPTGEYVQRNPQIGQRYFNASGSTGLSWVFHEGLNLKLNLGSGFRVPTAVELSTNGVHHGNFRHEVGNPDLRSERSYQVDLNVSYLKRKLLVSISPFYSFYSGFIYLGPSGRFSEFGGTSAVWQYKQNDAIFGGGEIKGEFSLLRNFNFTLGGEYVYNYNLDTGLPLPLTPPFSLISGVAYRIEKLNNTVQNVSFFGEVRLVSSQDRVDRNERPTPGYHLVDVGLSWDIFLYGQAIKFQLSAQNITNQIYFNHLSRYRLINIPEQGRNISANLKIPFETFIKK